MSFAMDVDPEISSAKNPPAIGSFDAPIVPIIHETVYQQAHNGDNHFNASPVPLVPSERPKSPANIPSTTPPPSDITPTVAQHPSMPPSIKPEQKPIPVQREQREKKDSWKKKEAKEQTTRKPSETATPSTTLPIRLRPPPYRQEDINATPRLPTFTSTYTTTTSDGRHLEFFRVSDQPFNKKKFRYTPCAAAPDLPQLMYRQIHLPTHNARINWQDMNPYILIDREGLTVTTEKGYRMARTNVCVREGDWYIEFKIERGGGDQVGHTRVGFARRESMSHIDLYLPSSVGCSCWI